MSYGWLAKMCESVDAHLNYKVTKTPWQMQLSPEAHVENDAPGFTSQMYRALVATLANAAKTSLTRKETVVTNSVKYLYQCN